MTKQCKRVLNHLRRHGKIDPLTSWRACGVYRLASRIHDLRKAGIGISKRWIHINNQFGEPVKFSEYYLNPNDKGVKSKNEINS